ncbi:hypothetical protein F2Q69_00018270 [Brassica cretica]|uniref:Uncharacterized protein n=1 Tax=Brassica cretica TaxID=69181 RepID=A0A8S9Q965_BRACR|nr:hypothetical protein F2Q69_00018270 [Brassica cretica]
MHSPVSNAVYFFMPPIPVNIMSFMRGRVEVKRGEVLLREVEATKAPSSPAQVSGRWLASSATSPRFCLRRVKAYTALRRRL